MLQKQAQTDDNSKEFLLKIRCVTVRTFCRNSIEVLDMSSGHATFAQRKSLRTRLAMPRERQWRHSRKMMDNKIKKGVEYLMVLYLWTFAENLAFAIYSASENLAISKTSSKNKQADVHANNIGVSRLYIPYFYFRLIWH